MTDLSRIKPSHTQRAAYVYIRQSTPGQVEHNRESTARQYALADKACQLGWPREQVVIVDEDLGLSGSSTDKRSGFVRLTSEVALAHVGIVLGLEVSRLARNNADWYRLLELCGVTDTLIGDNDGVYHPALFNDRLLLGLKGTMSEAELHIIRARLDGGIRNKAARGELRRGLPVGFVWGEQDGEVLFHPDEAVSGAIRTVFERFAEFGEAFEDRADCLWALSGENRMARSCFIPMKPSAALSARSSNASPNSDRHAASGFGSAPRVCLFRCKPRPPVYRVRSAGSFRLTPQSTTSSPIRCMLALTPTARPNTNATSMSTARSENGFGIFLWISGPFSSWTIIPASLIGAPFKPIRHGSTPIPDRSPISQGAL